YNQEYDGASTPVTETWTYNTTDHNGLGTVTAPDGGVTKTYAVPNNYSVWNAGLVNEIENPDGSKIEKIWVPNNLGTYNISSSRGDNPYVKTEFTSIKNA